MTTHRPLPERLERFTNIYQLVKRVGDAAIYSVTATMPHKADLGYEVIEILKHDGYEIGGKQCEPAEQYPPSTKWGIYGFTVPNMERAEAKLKEVLQRIADRNVPVKHTTKRRTATREIV